MNLGCPNLNCNAYLSNSFQIKDGFYFRRDDSRKIQRYKCKICKTKYSRATFTLEKYQKKRRINLQVRAQLSMGVSQRNCAYALKVARKTIERKLIYLSEKAKLNQNKFLEELKNNPITDIQFDDLISSIHTKLKPVSVSVVTCPKTFLILGAAVSEIPAFGKLAEISRRKYGRRKNFHTKNLDQLIGKLSPYIDPLAEFKTDEHKRYAEIIKKHFPNSKHKTFKGQLATVVGMGELKSKKYDPLFAINHTLACFRYGMNRFIRRTWCTSKKLENIQHHINIFIDYHNERKLNRM
jgi:transposase-like protein